MRVETWLNASSTLPFFRLYKSGNLSEHFAVIGTARRPWSKEYFESVVVESILDWQIVPNRLKSSLVTSTIKVMMSMIPNITSLYANCKIAWMKNTKRNTTRSSSCPWLLNFLEPLPNTSNQKALWMGKALSAWSLKTFRYWPGNCKSAQQGIGRNLWWRTNLPDRPLSWKRNDPKYLCHSFWKSYFW